MFLFSSLISLPDCTMSDSDDDWDDLVQEYLLKRKMALIQSMSINKLRRLYEGTSRIRQDWMPIALQKTSADMTQNYHFDWDELDQLAQAMRLPQFVVTEWRDRCHRIEALCILISLQSEMFSLKKPGALVCRIVNFTTVWTTRTGNGLRRDNWFCLLWALLLRRHPSRSWELEICKLIQGQEVDHFLLLLPWVS